jgi:hypothetical protein
MCKCTGSFPQDKNVLGVSLVRRKMALIVKTHLCINHFRYFINSVFLKTKSLEHATCLKRFNEIFLAFKIGRRLVVIY